LHFIIFDVWLDMSIAERIARLNRVLARQARAADRQYAEDEWCPNAERCPTVAEIKLAISLFQGAIECHSLGRDATPTARHNWNIVAKASFKCGVEVYRRLQRRFPSLSK
jgi:hypothetical protein